MGVDRTITFQPQLTPFPSSHKFGLGNEKKKTITLSRDSFGIKMEESDKGNEGEEGTLHFFINLSCYPIGILNSFHFSVNFHCYLMGNLHFFIFILQFAFCHFPMLFNGNLIIEKLLGAGGRTYGQTDGPMKRWTDGHKEIHPCVLEDIGPLGPLPKKVSLAILYINKRER